MAVSGSSRVLDTIKTKRNGVRSFAVASLDSSGPHCVTRRRRNGRRSRKSSSERDAGEEPAAWRTCSTLHQIQNRLEGENDATSACGGECARDPDGRGSWSRGVTRGARAHWQSWTLLRLSASAK
ncbi:hypothetical protein B566_EDAN007699 [Ephemera danica]|nr:hypothetical protein B566_EDAN007699 [Ephemera danica]